MSELSIEMKTALDSIKSGVEGFNSKFDKLQRQVDAIDVRSQGVGFLRDGGGGGNPVAELVRKMMDGRGDFEKHGRLRFETPSLLQSKTVTSAGIVTPSAMPTIADSGRFAYGNVRRAMRTVPTNAASVFRPKETAHAFEASPQVESSAKNEATVTLSADTLNVRTIATWVAVTKQAMDDAPGLGEFLQSSLVWAIEREVEEQLVSGDGTSQNLTGLTSIATVADTSFLSVANGWQYADVLAAAGVQLMELGAMPTHYLVNPRDWFALETLKTSTGEYILGSPRDAFKQALWSKIVIPTPAVTQGVFLCIDGGRCVIRQRQAMTIDLSTEHNDFFSRNQIALRVEERLCLVTMGPAAIYGSLSQSPV